MDWTAETVRKTTFWQYCAIMEGHVRKSGGDDDEEENAPSDEDYWAMIEQLQESNQLPAN